MSSNMKDSRDESRCNHKLIYACIFLHAAVTVSLAFYFLHTVDVVALPKCCHKLKKLDVRFKSVESRLQLQTSFDRALTKEDERVRRSVPETKLPAMKLKQLCKNILKVGLKIMYLSVTGWSFWLFNFKSLIAVCARRVRA